jgi:4a-hydroxytetrahydrobiopterin dehydratase
MTRLSDEEVRAALAEGLSAWGFRDDALHRTFRFDTFRAAIDFVDRVADQAEAADHHPDLLIRYTRVSITLSTHTERGVTAKDVALARTIDALAGPEH